MQRSMASSSSNKLAALANAQFESPEYRRLFALKWTRERARIYIVQRSISCSTGATVGPICKARCLLMSSK